MPPCRALILYALAKSILTLKVGNALYRTAKLSARINRLPSVPREGEVMVLWCRSCGALMGVHYPYTDWHVDRDALCPDCAERESIIAEEERTLALGPSLAVTDTGSPFGQSVRTIPE